MEGATTFLNGLTAVDKGACLAATMKTPLTVRRRKVVMIRCFEVQIGKALP